MAVINSKLLATSALLGLLLFTSCEEQVAMGDKLTQAERDYLRAREAAKCISASNETFEDFETRSNDRMVDFTRGQTWKVEYKKDSTVLETDYLYVWKVDGTTVYFRYRTTEDGIVKNKFFKIDTTTNHDLLASLQYKYCYRDELLDNLSLGTTAMTAVAEDETRSNVGTDEYVYYSTDYKLNASYPAFFGYFQKTKTKKTYTTATTQTVSKTETFSHTLTASSATTLPSSYTDATIVNRYYCGVDFADPVPPATIDNYDFPFDLECPTTSDTGTVDLNGDATVDFDPATEL